MANQVDQVARNERRIRDMIWYERFAVLSMTVRRGKHDEIMMAVYSLINSVHGFRYYNISQTANEALQLVLREHNDNPIIR